MQVSRAALDLDNLRLADIPPERPLLRVQYALSHLLVAGQCADASAGGGPAAGLSLALTLPSAAATDATPPAQESASSSSSSPSSSGFSAYSDSFVARFQTDTVVMQNLGYLQLQVPTPGLWTVGVPHASPHRDVFALVEVDGQPLAAAAGNTQEHAGEDDDAFAVAARRELALLPVLKVHLLELQLLAVSFLCVKVCGFLFAAFVTGSFPLFFVSFWANTLRLIRFAVSVALAWRSSTSGLWR